jgi:hypothetical protein
MPPIPDLLGRHDGWVLQTRLPISLVTVPWQQGSISHRWKSVLREGKALLLGCLDTSRGFFKRHFWGELLRYQQRPRGMHQRTYMRLRARDLLLLKASVGALHKRLST